MFIRNTYKDVCAVIFKNALTCDVTQNTRLKKTFCSLTLSAEARLLGDH